MKEEKKIRRLKNLIGVLGQNVWIHHRSDDFTILRDRLKLKEQGHHLQDHDLIKEIFDLVKDLGYDDKTLHGFWLKTMNERNVNKFHQTPPRETRDNKKVLNRGSGNRHGKTIRYPRQARSLATWRRFYELFPYAAEIDGWNGQTSSEYKPKRRK